MNQSEKEGPSQDLIKELRTGRPTKVTIKTCVRDLRNVSVIVDPTTESVWAQGVDIINSWWIKVKNSNKKTIRTKLKKKVMKMRDRLLHLLRPLSLLLPLLLPLLLTLPLLRQLSLRLRSPRLRSYQYQFIMCMMFQW